MMRTQALLRQSVLLLGLALPAAGCAAAAAGAAGGVCAEWDKNFAEDIVTRIVKAS